MRNTVLPLMILITVKLQYRAIEAASISKYFLIEVGDPVNEVVSFKQINFYVTIFT